MRRRDFVKATAVSAMTWPLVARAQQPGSVRRIGVLHLLAADDPEGKARNAAFVQGLAQFGWTDGSNIRIETRAAGDAERIRKYTTELVALAPDVIVANGSAIVGPLLQATRTVPIVFVNVPDPVGAGFVDSLARPGGNATGFTNFEYGIGAKWLELLKQMVPGVTRIGVVRDPAITAGIGQFGAIQSVAPSFGVQLMSAMMPVRSSVRLRPSRAARAAACHRERVDARSSQSDHQACGPVQTASRLQCALLRS
jgi:putative ABC transport system substrate-binding protein